MDEIELTTWTVEVRGIELDYTDPHTGQIERVRVSLQDLTDLREQDRWDSEFYGKVLLFDDPAIEWALEQHGLGVKETRGGFHRTEKLVEFMDSKGWY